MAEADETFYREVVRAGYRGPYLRKLATDVAEGTIDLEELNDRSIPDDEVAARLVALPGVGPYAAAHVMLTSLGKDATIERRFKRYGEWAGLAFWCPECAEREFGDP